MKRFLIPLSGDDAKKPKTSHGEEEANNDAGVRFLKTMVHLFSESYCDTIIVRSDELSFMASPEPNHLSSCHGMRMASVQG